MHPALTLRRGLVAVTALAAAMTPVVTAVAAPGDTDAGFGSAGQVTLDNHFGAELLVLPDDLIVVAGSTATDPSAVDVWQFRPDGTPNASFGTGGRIRLAPTAVYEDLMLARDPGSGQIYVSAFIDDGTSTTRIWRLTAGGDLDTSWGTTGIATYPNTRLDAIAVQSTSHRLVVAVKDHVRRLTATGGIDSGFGTGGVTVLDMETAGGIVALPGGRLVIGATATDSLRAFRLTSSGLPDPSWSGDGQASYAPPVPADTTAYSVWPASVAVRPGGQVVLVAAVNQSRPGAFDVPLVIVQLTATGSLDPAFTPRYRTGFEAQRGQVALQVNGKLLISGRTAGSLDTGIQRLRPDGRIDGSFGDAGVLSDADDQTFFLDVAVQRSGRVLLSGVTGTWPSIAAFVRGVDGDRVPKCHGRWPTQVGSGGADRLVGTSGRDVLVGLRGADTLLGQGGRDTLCAGGGADLLTGGAGADLLDGGGGRDRLVGGPGKDTLLGGPGADVEQQ